LPAITVDPKKQEVSRDKTKVKSSLQQQQSKSLEPGSRTRQNPNLDSDIERFKELDEKLRRLAEMSRTSHETFVADDAPATETQNVATTSVQTSLTDLTNLGRRPGVNVITCLS
jgi:hypothetical protein